MTFLETMRPTSVDLSRNGKSASSYKSKSMVVPAGYVSRVRVDVGQILRIGGVRRADRLPFEISDEPDNSALNYLVN